MKLLAIDTATENCSAALWLDGQILHREKEAERGHGDVILHMVDELLVESGCTLSELQAIAFGRGPGSFTGVRLAASVTQGLAFGAGVPVIPISDLRAVAQRTVPMSVDGWSVMRRTLVCNDARMKEVYWGCFEQDAAGLMRLVGQELVTKPEAVSLPEEWSAEPKQDVCGAGRGFAAYPDLHERWTAQLANIDSDLLPRAREIAVLAAAEARDGRLLPPEEAVPMYLRDDVARPKA